MSKITDNWKKTIIILNDKAKLDIKFVGRICTINDKYSMNFEETIGFLKGYIEKIKEIECEHAAGIGKNFLD